MADSEVNVRAVRYGSVRQLKVAVSGAGGLIGRALLPFLEAHGHSVLRLARGVRAGEGCISWDPVSGTVDTRLLADIDVIIHLAGESVASGRWTAKRRAAIRESRIGGTRLLVDAFAKNRRRPFAFICASASGYYGNTGEKAANEDSSQGSGFLAEVCAAWETEAMRAEELGMRVVRLRTGIVLAPDGGALGKMLPLFRLGLGGVLGGGDQWMSWISREDLVGAIYHSILDLRCTGAVNAVAPAPVRNREFTRALAAALKRPAFLPVPAIMLKLALGEMADEMLLSSSRIVPQKLLDAGYDYKHETLDAALCDVLGLSARA